MGQKQSSLETMAISGLNLESCFSGVYRGKTVFVTGHTGFKGGWLVLWLKALGAKVVGYSLAPSTQPSLFGAVRVGDEINHIIGDIRDFPHLSSAMADCRPDIVFHLAAQPLVRRSYQEPRETYETNIMGSINVLESVRQLPQVRVCINVTSDKCYENRESKIPYRENDAMGGHDPYSSSKGAVEVVAAAYRRSFFSDARTALVSVRAGNVIGGGDWSEDRIIPDCIRALSAGHPIEVRNPEAVRPWQHVLEPLSGYLLLGSLLWNDPVGYDYGWNFGPQSPESVPVREVVKKVVRLWGSGDWVGRPETQRGKYFHEAGLLRLDCSKAALRLGWAPVYGIDEAIEKTIQWYRNFYKNPDSDSRDYSLSEIAHYSRRAAAQNLSWAKKMTKDAGSCPTRA